MAWLLNSAGKGSFSLFELLAVAYEKQFLFFVGIMFEKMTKLDKGEKTYIVLAYMSKLVLVVYYICELELKSNSEMV